MMIDNPIKRPKSMDLIAATTMIDAAFIDVLEAVEDDEEACEYFQFLRNKVTEYLKSELLLAMLYGEGETTNDETR